MTSRSAPLGGTSKRGIACTVVPHALRRRRARCGLGGPSLSNNFSSCSHRRFDIDISINSSLASWVRHQWSACSKNPIEPLWRAHHRTNNPCKKSFTLACTENGSSTPLDQSISRIFNGLCPNRMLNSKYSTPSFSTLCEPEGPPSEILLHEIVHRRHHEYLARGELRLARF